MWGNSISDATNKQEAEKKSPKFIYIIGKYIENIKSILGYGPKSENFRIAKIDRKTVPNNYKNDCFDLEDGRKAAYIDGTFFLYKKTVDSNNKNIEIINKIQIKEPGLEPVLYQKNKISNPNKDIHHIAYTFFQESEKVIWSQEIPMIIIQGNKILHKPMMAAFSSTEEPIIEILDNTIFRIKTHMGGKDKYQYYDTVKDCYGEKDETIDGAIKWHKPQEIEINL